jgi:hypothetical protein
MIPKTTSVNNIAELRFLFESYVEEHPQLKEFVFGDYQKIESLNRSELNYPVLWLETPSVNYDLSRNFQRVYNCSFVILEGIEKDNWTDIEIATAKTEQLAHDVVMYMKEDSEQDILRLENNARIGGDFVPFFGSDLDCGWRVSFQVRVMLSHTLSTSKRQRVCPVGTLPWFSFNNATAGSFNNLTIQNTTLPENEAWQYEWTYEIDGGGKVSSQLENPIISGAGNWIFVQLKITQGDCVKYASAYFSNDKQVGESVPWVVEW